MKYTKRIAVLILCTVMCLCFVGCGKTKETAFENTEEMTDDISDDEGEKSDETNEKSPYYVDFTARYIGISLEELKNKVGSDLSGPTSEYANIVRQKSDVYCSNQKAIAYYNVSYGDCYIVLDGEVIIHDIGLSGSMPLLREVLNDEALNIAPACWFDRQVSGQNLLDCVWKLNNGYLSIIVCPIKGSGYLDYLVYSYTYVTDKEYLLGTQGIRIDLMHYDPDKHITDNQLNNAEKLE